MAKRIGLGKGKGKGYKNLAGRDPKIHSDSSKGRKQPQRIDEALERRINNEKSQASKFACGICKTTYFSPTQATLCCLEEKRKIGVENPKKSLKEIKESILKRQTVILKEQKYEIKRKPLPVYEEKRPLLVKSLGEESVVDLENKIEKIESSIPTTQNHYGNYMSLLSKFQGENRMAMANLFVLMGANKKGVVDALKNI